MFANRMLNDRVFIKDARGTVIKPGTVDLTPFWKAAPTVNSKHWRLSLARKRMALMLAARKK